MDTPDLCEHTSTFAHAYGSRLTWVHMVAPPGFFYGVGDSNLTTHGDVDNIMHLFSSYISYKTLQRKVPITCL